MPKQYNFTFTYNLKLKSGKTFKRSGEMKGFSISDIKSKLPEGCNPIIKPIIEHLSGSDARFYNNFQTLNREDIPN